MSNYIYKNKEIIDDCIKGEIAKLKILRSYKKNVSPGSARAIIFYDKLIGDTCHKIRALKFSSFCIQFYLDSLKQL